MSEVLYFVTESTSDRTDLSLLLLLLMFMTVMLSAAPTLFQEDLYMFVRAKDFLKRSSRPLLQFLRIVQRIMFTNGALLRTESRMMFQNLSVSVQGELR